MAYGASDPRSTLTQATSAAPTHGAAPTQYFQFDLNPPTEVSDQGSPSWWVRSQNFVMAMTRLRPGDTLGQEDDHEYAVILPGASGTISISTDHGSADVAETALAVVPRGSSAVTAVSSARSDTDEGVLLFRLFDTRSPLVGKAVNAAAYALPDPNVRLLSPWPDPPAGDALRVYYPDRVTPTPGRFGRIYRTSSFMVNFLEDQAGPRDSEKLSPHKHDDFEQCSLTIEGTFVHHMRTPWTPRRSEWRPDEHEYIGSPSLTIIPPPTIHTTEAVGQGLNRMIDIFSPPRVDFSSKPGWVLNAADYPAEDPVDDPARSGGDGA